MSLNDIIFYSLFLVIGLGFITFIALYLFSRVNNNSLPNRHLIEKQKNFFEVKRPIPKEIIFEFDEILDEGIPNVVQLEELKKENKARPRYTIVNEPAQTYFRNVSNYY